MKLVYRYAVDITGSACAIDWSHPDEGYVSYMSLLCVFSFFIPMSIALFALWRSYSNQPTSQPQQGSASESSNNQQTAALTEDTLRGVSNL